MLLRLESMNSDYEYSTKKKENPVKEGVGVWEGGLIPCIPRALKEERFSSCHMAGIFTEECVDYMTDLLTFSAQIEDDLSHNA